MELALAEWVELETLKERIKDLFRKAKKKIVIFIDDIDRLDKLEIHSIFRLVKITADFANTIYVLSFNDDLVKQLHLIAKLMNEANPFGFASELFYELKRKDKYEENEFFSDKKYQTIMAHLITRAQKESIHSSVFEKFPAQTA